MDIDFLETLVHWIDPIYSFLKTLLQALLLLFGEAR